jgi:hypothetical protein
MKVSNFVRVYRFKINNIRRNWSKFRLGARGKQALSRLLTSEELPLDTLGIRYERAYTSRRTALNGASREYVEQVITERSFAIPGINRFLTIVVRPHQTVEEVKDAFDYFAESIKKRYAHLKYSHVEESRLALANIPNSRLVETRAEYMGEEFRILGIACIVGTELLIVESQCAANSQWSISDCELVVRKQIQKLDGSVDSDLSEGSS